MYPIAHWSQTSDPVPSNKLQAVSQDYVSEAVIDIKDPVVILN